jgi:hypothetical protein
MERAGFWYGRRAVGRLRLAHLAAALATVAATLVLPAFRYDLDPAAGAAPAAWLRVAGALLVVLLAAIAVVVLVAVVGSGRTEDVLDDREDGAVVRWLHLVALGACLAAALYSGWSRPGWISAGPLPGAASVFSALAAAQLVLVLGLVVVTLVLSRPGPAGPRPPTGRPALRTPAGKDDQGTGGPPGGGPAGGPPDQGSGAPQQGGAPRAPGFGGPDGAALRGFGGPATAMLACGLGVLFTSGVTVWVADWLNRGAGAGQHAVPRPPLLLTWHAVCLPVILVLLAAQLLVGVLRTLGHQRRLAPQVADAYQVPEGQTGHHRTGAIAGALARARLTDSGPVLIGMLALLALLASTGSLLGALICRATPADAAGGTAQAFAYATDTAQATGSWLFGTTMATLVMLGRRAYKGTAARRTVGILWDIGTFWPRAAHPFAPPCYAERAVPDLVARVRAWCAAGTGGRIVVSAHSQGTVIAAAALWQLPTAIRYQVGLLTYGSPLRRLYARFFPAYLGPDDLARLCGHVPVWRNLYRCTDPIGGPVRLGPPHGAEPVDATPFIDPICYGRTAECPLPTPVEGHSRYQADPRFAEERTALLARLL